MNALDAQPNSWPWQVSLRDTANNTHVCGGSIIAEKWILTAAQCLHGLSTDDIQVVAGAHETTSNQLSQRVFVPTAFFLHLDYDNQTLHNDIALIKLAEAIQYNDVITPVCLPSSPSIPGAVGTITGWGLTPNRTSLTELHVPIISHGTCSSQQYWGNLATSDMVCAGYRRHSMCRADTGGPFVWNNNGNGAYSLVGVTSFVSRQCNNQQGIRPTVFTNVYNYVAWI